MKKEKRVCVCVSVSYRYAVLCSQLYKLLSQPIKEAGPLGEILKVMPEWEGNAVNHHQLDLSQNTWGSWTNQIGGPVLLKRHQH